MANHARIARPSAARQIVQCPGSGQLQERYPESEASPAALEGTAAHWFAAEALHGRPITTGQVAPNGVALDVEMWETVDTYVDIVESGSEGATLYIETPMPCPSLHPECWGTPDAFAIKPRLIRLWDFKNGHQYVEEFENWQLLCYVAGILDWLQIDGHEEQYTVVEMSIVQPNVFSSQGPCRTWRAMASDLRQYFNILRHAFRKAFDADAEFVTGGACEYCSAQACCAALQKDAYKAVHLSKLSTPFQLDAAMTGYELRNLERAIEILQYRKKGISQQAEEHMRNGHNVPFYSMAGGEGRKVWKYPAEQVAAAFDSMGVDVRDKLKLLTPTQAKSLPIDPALIDSFAERKPAALKLTALDSLTVRKAFFRHEQR